MIRHLILEGIGGLCAEDRWVLPAGRPVLVGRSRRCDVSLARTRVAQRLGRDALAQTEAFRRISRIHFRISWVGPDSLRIEDLSTNGVRIDGRRLRRLELRASALAQVPTRLRFGDGEELRLRARG